MTSFFSPEIELYSDNLHYGGKFPVCLFVGLFVLRSVECFYNLQIEQWTKTQLIMV